MPSTTPVSVGSSVSMALSCWSSPHRHSFILIGTIDLSLPETLMMGCAGTLLQVLWRATKRCRPEQVLFSVASMALAIKTCYAIYHSSFGGQFGIHGPLLLVIATSAFFYADRHHRSQSAGDTDDGLRRDIAAGAVARYKTLPARASPFQRGKHGAGDQDLLCHLPLQFRWAVRYPWPSLVGHRHIGILFCRSAPSISVCRRH